MGQPLEGFLASQSPRPIGAGVVPCPNMGAQDSHICKLVKTGIAGALQIDLGLLSIRVLFRNRMKNEGVMGPDVVREIACGV